MDWYAVSAKPHQEHVAHATLQHVGVETYCPLLRQNRIIRRRLQVVVAPLFPGYLFAKFDLERQYRAVAYARGVRRIVMFGSQSATVDEALLNAIKARSSEGYVTIDGSGFESGQSVFIREGPLAGLRAVFEREMTGHERAVLLLRCLAYQARVEVDLKAIVNM